MHASEQTEDGTHIKKGKNSTYNTVAVAVGPSVHAAALVDGNQLLTTPGKGTKQITQK